MSKQQKLSTAKHYVKQNCIVTKAIDRNFKVGRTTILQKTLYLRIIIFY